MGSMITTTTSPPTHLVQLQHIAAQLPASDGTLLTTPHRPGFLSATADPTATSRPTGLQEPPPKRIRLDPVGKLDHRLSECQRRQVLPHVELQIATLPKDRVNPHVIGKQVVALLTGPEFVEEYNRRGDGTISREFETRLAHLAAYQVQFLGQRLIKQLAPSGTPSPSTTPAPPLHRIETPVPVPYYAHGQSAPTRTPSSTAPRYSSSPIPLPAIPNYPPTKGHGRANGTQLASQQHIPPRPPPEVIVIDDDDDTPSRKPAPVKRPGQTRPPEPPRTPLLKQEPPVQAPQATSTTPTLAIRATPVSPSKPVATTPPAARTVSIVRLSPVGPREPTVATPHATGFQSEAPTQLPPIIATPLAARVPVTVTPPVVSSQTRQSTSTDWKSEADTSIARVPPALGAKSVCKWFSKRQRQPYLTAEQRASIVEGAQSPLQLYSPDLTTPITIHVDFTGEEVRYLEILARRTLGSSMENSGRKDSKKALVKILKKNRSYIPAILNAFVHEGRLPSRTKEDVSNLFIDLIAQRTRSDLAVLSLARDDDDRRGDAIRSSRVHSLLLAREISGQRGFGTMRTYQQFNNEFRKSREDSLDKRAEWTGCAGDIMTIVWVSNDGFICGTTEHSDSHNQQYNKPGNLVLGSCSSMTLSAYPEHRIVRPVVEKGENSTEAMVQSQDPWLYSSVVASDYDDVHDRAFTCSFDRTVKIWKVDKSGASMRVLGEWQHDGNVNFVAASKHESGMVATAADVATQAIRIYNISESDISGSPFRGYSCSRVTDDRGNTVSTERWAYYPATMQWGLADGVKHLLLVGYSPRSRTGDDSDIPLDRRDSGELLLWDGITGERWNVTSARTQNVFEVLWHPTQESFIAATSPLIQDLESRVRTQIRIFRLADKDEFGTKAFSPIMALDCTAVDINELTIMPNSYSFSYITAGCTDGKTYVWDTARGDKPIHVLRHGEPIDEYNGDREREDVGVKFTAWGTTPDRFYTGSSDGVVKVWNVRSLDKPFIRNLLEAPAPITAGMFSPDRSRLVVGDASGRVFVLSLHEEKEQPLSVTKIPIPGGFRTIRRPPAITPHADPPPPTHDAEGRPITAETAPTLGRAFLDNLQLERHSNPTIGVVQGPRYAETGLFRKEMHFNEDPSQPLLAQWEAMQQEAWKPHKPFLSKGRDQRLALRPLRDTPALGGLHIRNKEGDLDVEELPVETRHELEREGVDFGLMSDYLLDEEE